SSGFLSPKYAPLMVGEVNYYQPQQGDNYDQVLKVADLDRFADLVKARFDSRVDLLQGLERDFVKERPGVATRSHQTAYERAVKLMRTSAAKAFNLSEESAKVRDAYGRNLFGQGCLLARRLVEQGVPFVEVTLGQFQGYNLGWDAHAQCYDACKTLNTVL